VTQYTGKNLINVCASGSSGSTLLSNMLDLHPDIACGDELFSFSTPLLYEDYNSFLQHAKLLRLSGIPGHPYHEGRVLFKHLNHFNLNSTTIWRWIRETNNFNDFVERLHNYIQQLTGKSFWAEKTPRNARLIHLFLKQFPDAKVLHLVRDPRDVVISLKRRGKSTLEAVNSWLTSVAPPIAIQNNPRLMHIRYEDLCRKPDVTLMSAISHIGVEVIPEYYNTDVHRSSSLIPHKGHKSWHARPGEKFSTKGIGGWKDHDLDWQRIGQTRLTSHYAKTLGLEQLTLQQIASDFGYDYPESSTINSSYQPFAVKLKSSALRRWIWQRAGVKDFLPAVEHSGLEI